MISRQSLTRLLGVYETLKLTLVAGAPDGHSVSLMVANTFVLGSGIMFIIFIIAAIVYILFRKKDGGCIIQNYKPRTKSN